MIDKNLPIHIELLEGSDLLISTTLLEQLAVIHASVNDMYTPTLFTRHKADTLEVLREKLYQRLIERASRGYNFYLLYIGDKLIGFNNHNVSNVYIKGDTYRTLEIGTTCILPQYQNKGYGSYLYSFMEMDSQLRYDIQAMTRTTWSTNLRQIHLYSSHGFSEYVMRKDHYGIEGLHLLEYCKILNEFAQ